MRFAIVNSLIKTGSLVFIFSMFAHSAYAYTSCTNLKDFQYPSKSGGGNPNPFPWSQSGSAADSSGDCIVANISMKSDITVYNRMPNTIQVGCATLTNLGSAIPEGASCSAKINGKSVINPTVSINSGSSIVFNFDTGKMNLAFGKNNLDGLLNLDANQVGAHDDKTVTNVLVDQNPSHQIYPITDANSGAGVSIVVGDTIAQVPLIYTARWLGLQLSQIAGFGCPSDKPDIMSTPMCVLQKSPMPTILLNYTTPTMSISPSTFLPTKSVKYINFDGSLHQGGLDYKLEWAFANNASNTTVAYLSEASIPFNNKVKHYHPPSYPLQGTPLNVQAVNICINPINNPGLGCPTPTISSN